MEIFRETSKGPRLGMGEQDQDPNTPGIPGERSLLRVRQVDKRAPVKQRSFRVQGPGLGGLNSFRKNLAGTQRADPGILHDCRSGGGAVGDSELPGWLREMDQDLPPTLASANSTLRNRRSPG